MSATHTASGTTSGGGNVSGGGNNSGGGGGRSRWAAVILTAALALVAFTVQWGVVSARLDGVEKRLDEFIVEARAMRTAYADLERRVAFIEGRASR